MLPHTGPIFVEAASTWIGSKLVAALEKANAFPRIVALDSEKESLCSPLGALPALMVLLIWLTDLVQRRCELENSKDLSSLIANYGTPRVVVLFAPLAHLAVLAEAAPGVHVIYISSFSDGSKGDRVSPSDLPAASLSSRDAWLRSSPLSFTILRPSNVYGPGNPSGTPIGHFIQRLYTGQLAELIHDGTDAYDFLHIGDFLSLVQSVAAKPQNFQGKTLDVGSGEMYSTAFVVECVAEALGIRSSFCKASKLSLYRKEVSYKLVTLGEINLATLDVLERHPKISLKEGIRETVQDFLSSKSKRRVVAIIATYSARYNLLLERSLPSVFAQTSLPDAIIIIDDFKNSSDIEQLRQRISSLPSLQKVLFFP